MENKRIKQKQGFSAIEFLTIICVAGILVAIIILMASNTADNQKRKVMAYNMLLFESNAGNYILEANSNKVFLQTLIDKKIFSSIKNPFLGEQYCDPYESFVTLEEEKKFVTLKCGNYLFDHQYAKDKSYSLYRVSDWKSEKINKSNNVEVEKHTFYNYQENKNSVLDRFYQQDAFLILFNKLNSTNYNSIQEIPKKYKIQEKTLYRSKIKVASIEL